MLSVSSVAQFDYEYAFINRLLPVQKVVFDRDDGLRVFVDTESDRLGRIQDDTSALGEEQLVSLEQMDRFDHEYGFVNKRLPVYRAKFATRNNITLYVETRSGVLAAAVTDQDRAESYSFAWLHKWRFLDGLGKAVRDSLQALAVLLFLFVGIMGGWLHWSRRGRCSQ